MPKDIRYRVWLGAEMSYYDDNPELERRILPQEPMPVLCLDCGYSVKLLNDCYAATGHHAPATVESLEARIEDLEGSRPYQFDKDFQKPPAAQPPKAQAAPNGPVSAMDL